LVIGNRNDCCRLFVVFIDVVQPRLFPFHAITLFVRTIDILHAGVRSLRTTRLNRRASI
jgi:hypothetical protein